MAENLKLLVTGGGGRIGEYLVPSLLERGHAVVNFDQRKQRDERAEFIFGDVRNRAQVSVAMRGCDAVIHLAEIAGPRLPVPTDEIYWGNTRAGSVVMQSAMDLKLRRIIYASTCQVYGCWEEDAAPPMCLPFDENHPTQPRNVYALSKVANEGYARFVHERSGMPVTIFRLPMVYFDRMLTRAMVRGMMEGTGPCEGFQTYIHPADAARAFVAAIDADRPGCEAYNIFAPDVASGIPIRPRLIRHHPDYPKLPEDWPDYKSPVSTAKAQEQLGWKAQWSFRTFAAKIMETP